LRAEVRVLKKVSRVKELEAQIKELEAEVKKAKQEAAQPKRYFTLPDEDRDEVRRLRERVADLEAENGRLRKYELQAQLQERRDEGGKCTGQRYV
jgi:hypothetical protein